jgi:sugar phosphate isomerase/epimerase
MIIALSTRWNASRHAAGESMADEILEAGFDHVELGYDFRVELLPGILNRMKSGTLRVVSLHAPCPIPLGLPSGDPESYTLADIDEGERVIAIRLVRDTIRLAADLGAQVVVAHAGNVDMPHYSYRIMDLLNSRRPESWWTQWRLNRLRTRLDIGRIKAVQPHIDALSRSIESLLPDLEAMNVRLALENLPSWESVPSEAELGALLEKFPSPFVGAWYDIGHGVIREKLGFSNPIRWLDKVKDRLAGMHVHDVNARLHDHLAPGSGTVDFSLFRKWAELDILRVVEVRPGLPVATLKSGLSRLRTAWEPQADPPTNLPPPSTGDRTDG